MVQLIDRIKSNDQAIKPELLMFFFLAGQGKTVLSRFTSFSSLPLFFSCPCGKFFRIKAISERIIKKNYQYLIKLYGSAVIFRSLFLLREFGSNDSIKIRDLIFSQFACIALYPENLATIRFIVIVLLFRVFSRFLPFNFFFSRM